ncbi:hypothetical protein DSECCO2_515830 [anaerobic digester metagenome]
MALTAIPAAHTNKTASLVSNDCLTDLCRLPIEFNSSFIMEYFSGTNTSISSNVNPCFILSHNKTPFLENA